MAMYISVPRDLTIVKTKVFFNLTKRQLICFGVGVAIGLPIFFLVKSVAVNISFATMAMLVAMMPCFIMAMYEKNGQPLEVVLKHFIEAKYVRSKIRPYKTNNYYKLLEQVALSGEENENVVMD